MTVGGVAGAEFLCETVLLVFSLILYSSNFFLLTSVCLLFLSILFLSILFLVILAKAGIHRTASVVVWYFRFIVSVAVWLFYVAAYCGEYVSKCDIRSAWMNGFPCARE
ncbi:hypothetical protein [Vibrio sp. 03_296]|uniref:hypothetical protein n=1 Tax=Vibrio sp. 03_296 TaxID=2024409 RepID=UPI001595DFE6|nr:hypothetical protein [Vibrio sp. 03_296]